MPVAKTLLMVLLIGAFGCASTNLSSMTKPEVAKRPYDRILVVFPLQDLELRRIAENEVLNKVRSRNSFMRSYELFFPGRQYEEQEILDILMQHNIQAVLMIGLSDSGTSSTYVPQLSSSTRCTAWTASQGCVAASTYTSGGYTLDKPWANFTATLFDLEKQEVVWYATAKTGGNAFADNADLVRSMARKTRDTLLEDGLVLQKR